MDRRTLAALSFYFPHMNDEDFTSLTGEDPDLRDDSLQKFLSEKPDVFRQIERDLETLDRLGAKITCIGDEDYPSQLLESLHPPVILTYLGEPVWRRQRMISVVGSREPDRRSYEWMDRHLPPVIREKKVAVVSGGARGIDQKAHAIAMRLASPTVVFLPSGLRKIYPAELKDWIPTIIDQGGAVVSEFSPYRAMYKGNFFRRNRMIAALGEVLVVIEAKISGGSMMTADWAGKHGKPIATLPAFPDEARYAGNNRLIINNAQVLITHWELAGLIK